MSSIVGSLLGIGSATLGNVAVFLPALIATIAYLQYDLMDPESKPLNMEMNELHDSYDFIVVGSGSAGNFVQILSVTCGSQKNVHQFQEQSWPTD